MACVTYLTIKLPSSFRFNGLLMFMAVSLSLTNVCNSLLHATAGSLKTTADNMDGFPGQYSSTDENYKYDHTRSLIKPTLTSDLPESISKKRNFNSLQKYGERITASDKQSTQKNLSRENDETRHHKMYDSDIYSDRRARTVRDVVETDADDTVQKMPRDNNTREPHKQEVHKHVNDHIGKQTQEAKERSEEHRNHLQNPGNIAFLERMYKRTLGLDDNKRMAPQRMRPINEYVRRLYSALKDEEDVMSESLDEGENLPATIRTIRHIYGPRSRQGTSKVFTFPVPKTGLGQVKRLELVLKISAQHLDGISDTDRISVALQTGHGAKMFDGRRFEDYFIFNISSIRDLFHVRLERSLIIGERVMHIRRTYDPLLIMFENIAYNPLFKSPIKTKRSADIDDLSPQDLNMAYTQSSHPLFHCNRYDWRINMDLFSWDWYILPPSYNAGFCKGDCPPVDSAVLNFTNYSYIKGLFHFTMSYTDINVPRECCTPVDYTSETILYYDENLNVVMRRLPNMKVASCGCR